MGKSLIVKGADFSAVAVEKVTPTSKVTVVVLASPTDGGSVSGNGTYDEGETLTIVATPASGYEFKQWQDGNTEATRIIKATSTTYTAIFAEKAEMETLEPIEKKSKTSVGYDGNYIESTNDSNYVYVYDVESLSGRNFYATARTGTSVSQPCVSYMDSDKNVLGVQFKSDGTATVYTDELLTVPDGTKYINVGANTKNVTPALKVL